MAFSILHKKHHAGHFGLLQEAEEGPGAGAIN